MTKITLLGFFQHSFGPQNFKFQKINFILAGDIQTSWGEEYWWPGEAQIGTKWINTAEGFLDRTLGLLGLNDKEKVKYEHRSITWSMNRVSKIIIFAMIIYDIREIAN